jgi:acylpyruvate hydrolase
VFHEVELGVMLKRGGKHFSKTSDWREDIGAYFLLLDYTDVEETKRAVQNGLPWYIAKNQDNFLYLSDPIDAQEIDDPHNVELELKINGELK